MTDYQLKIFITAAETLNFTTASEILYLTQPSLSRQIAALENELGVKLFYRQHNILELTGAGKLFYSKVIGIHSDLTSAVKSVRDFGAGIEGRLRIGLMEDQRLLQSMVNSVHALLTQYPRLEIDITRYNYHDLLDKLDHNEIDVFQALLYEGLPEDRYQVLRLELERMFLAYNPKFKEIRETYLENDQEISGILGDYPVFLVGTSTYPYLVRNHLPLIQISSAHFVDTVSSIPLYLITGMGTSIVNQNNMISIYPDIALIPMGALPVAHGVVWRGDSDNPILYKLLDNLRNCQSDAQKGLPNG